MPRTQEEVVVSALRTGILSGEVPTGKFLSQRKLADQFGTSLITLRAALRRIENEGLIENVPRWGVRIPDDTQERVRDRYFVREILELAALERAMSCLDAVKRARLLDLARICDGVEGADDVAVRAFSQAHTALHRCLVEYAGSPLLLVEYDRLIARNLMLTNARRVWARGDRSGDHHQGLMQGMLDASPARAAAALRSHIRRGMKNELRQMQDPARA